MFERKDYLISQIKKFIEALFAAKKTEEIDTVKVSKDIEEFFLSLTEINLTDDAIIILTKIDFIFQRLDKESLEIAKKLLGKYIEISSNSQKILALKSLLQKYQ